MTPKEALNNIATISEILVEVSKSHIMANEAINEIRGLDISEIYFTLKQSLNELEALKRDVARYLELEKTSFLSPLETREYVELYGKLIKAGKEE